MMSKNLEEPLHTNLHELEVTQGLTKPKTFACNHNRDVCSNCEMSVRRWIKKWNHLLNEANNESP